MKNESLKHCLLFAVVSLLSCFCSAQTPVILMPVPQPFFVDGSGRPLAFGCVFTYQSGTTTPLATYTDTSGETQNANPVVLDASGAGNIWLQAGQSYSVTVKAAGGVNCASGSQRYSISGIAGGTSQLTTAVPYSVNPTFTSVSQNQLFTMTLTGLASSLPLVAVGISSPSFITFQLTQDVVGGHSFVWPANVIGGSPIDTTANHVTTQTFIWNGSNATATGPATTSAGSTQIGILNNVAQPNGVGVGFVLQNISTTLNTLTKLSASGGSPGLSIAATTDTTGIIGVTVAGAGNSGNGTVITSGAASCVFDGTTVAPHYVQISQTIAGNCHDAGATYPSSGQVIGRLLDFGTGPGTYAVELFSPEIQAGNTIAMTNAGSLGTTLNTLTKLTGAPSTAVLTAAGDTGGSIGITVANAGTSGTAMIQQSGAATCVFDGSTTAGDYVQISPTVAGNCHDAGVAYPTVGQVIGRVLVTAGAGTTALNLFNPEIHADSFPRVVFSTPSAATSTSISPVTMATSGAAGNAYRFSFYADQTIFGTGCSTNTTVTLFLNFTDPNASPGANTFSAPALTITTNGTIGPMGTGNFIATIRNKASQVVTYSVAVSAGTCTTQPFFQIYPILEVLQ